ncbi:MAG: fluoride efflux transporter FluC [Propioniciclava sp.]
MVGSTRITDEPSGGRPLTATRAGGLALIFLGGLAGTLARIGLDAALPTADDGIPWATLTVNVSGAFLLGAILEVLTTQGGGWQHAVRLAIGTGFLGGYTTYSALSVETLHLVRNDAVLAGLAYAVGSICAGLTAAAAGFSLARRIAPDRAGAAA